MQVPPAADAAMAAAVPSLVADAEPFEHDPDLEEAAIRFASGDFEGAEAGLREIMTQPPQDGARPGRGLAGAVRPVPRHRSAGSVRHAGH